MEKTHKVLIADDHSDNLLFLRKLLESIGYEVVEAENGKEALGMAQQQKPDLIISDILMPVMDGFKLCIEVKKNSNLNKIPFIFYTATYTDKKDEEFALSLGAAEFIVKPAEPAEFIKRIKSVVEDHEAGILSVAKSIIEDEKEVFKLYNERLVHKLEQKAIELEKEIAERVKTESELRKKVSELKQFNYLTVDREIKMVDLKKEINDLLKEAGKEPRY